MELNFEQTITFAAIFGMVSEKYDNTNLEIPGWLLRYIKETYLTEPEPPAPNVDEFSIEG